MQDFHPEIESTSLAVAQRPVSTRGFDVVVPIRSLGENHRERIAEHLRSLDAQDRYFRFGFTASDDQITALRGRS
jgi:hypothetical protein